MTHWYSPSMNKGKGGFGLVAWGEKKRPADAVDVSAAEHAALFPPGEPQREFETGPDGKPRWKMPAIEDQRAAAVSAVKREAGRRIDAVLPLHRQLNAIREGRSDDIGFARLDAVRAASNAIEQDLRESENPAAVPIADHPMWPVFEPESGEPN